MVSECCNARMEVVSGPFFCGENNSVIIKVKTRCDGCNEVKNHVFSYEWIRHLVVSYIDEYERR